jgi:hypothetical protein
MSSDEFTTTAGTAPDPNALIWSRPGSGVILPEPLTPAELGTQHEQAVSGSVARARAWSILSGPALSIAAFAFACAQAVGGVVAGPVASLIPGAADSPANHVRIIAVIYIGMSCTGGVFAWFALQRAGDEADAPRWASHLAGAAIVVCALVTLQALLLLVLTTLAPGGAPS